MLWLLWLSAMCVGGVLSANRSSSASSSSNSEIDSRVGFLAAAATGSGSCTDVRTVDVAWSARQKGNVGIGSKKVNVCATVNAQIFIVTRAFMRQSSPHNWSDIYAGRYTSPLEAMSCPSSRVEKLAYSFHSSHEFPPFSCPGSQLRGRRADRRFPFDLNSTF